MMEKAKRFFFGMLQYVVPYFLGIIAALLFSPVDSHLAGHNLLLLYPIFAIPAFCFFPTDISLPLFGPDWIFVILYGVSISAIVFGIAAHFKPLRRYHPLGARLIGFTLGSTGTIAVFYLSMASI